MESKLTDTQLELVVLVANGYRHDEIAERTHRSTTTVKTTLSRAQQRVGARTLPHLVSIVIASGVLIWSDDGERSVHVEGPGD